METAKGREIKFRAWHRDSKLMFDVLAIAFQNKQTIVKWHGVERAIPTNQFVLLQCTSLIDKNGVEIYERDVVKAFNKVYDDSPAKNIIEFKQGCWKAVAKGKVDMPLFNYKSEELEVIGNLYTNPELLNQ